jgi:predicted RND superfamily exporter protein
MTAKIPLLLRLIQVTTVVIIVITLFGLERLKTNADYRVYFDKSAPLLLDHNLVREKYSDLDSLIVVLTAEHGSLLEPAYIDFYQAVSARLIEVTNSAGLNSFYQIIDDDFGVPSATSSDKLLALITENYRYRDLITATGKRGLLVINADLPGIDKAGEVKHFVSTAKAILEQELATSNIALSLNYSGLLALNDAYITVVSQDLKRFIPLLLLIYSACLFYFLRSARLVGILLANGLLSVLLAFGVAGYMGWELAAINAFTPVIIISLNIAISMHIVMRYLSLLARGEKNTESVNNSISYNFKALTFSAATTIFGFLLLLVSPSPPVAVVGLIVALGVLFSYFQCLTILRFCLKRSVISQDHAQRVGERVSLQLLVNLVLTYSSKILFAAVAFSVAGIVAVSQLTIDDNVYQYFPANHSLRQATTLIDQHFYGSMQLVYSIGSGSNFGVFEQQYVNRLNDFTAWLETQSGVAKITSSAAILSANKSRFAKVQQFFQGSKSSDYDYQHLISENYRSSKLVISLQGLTASKLIAFENNTSTWLKAHLSAYEFHGGVGNDILFAKLGEQNARSLFLSLALALVLIALIIGILLRSVKAMVIAVVCNSLPVIVVFAIWSLVGGYISLGGAMVMGMVLGIIVDDTLHLLFKYRAGTSFSNSIELIYQNVCPAIVVSSITLSLAFVVGLFSEFRPIYELSLLSFFIIVVAMLTDLLVLPALMKSLKYGVTADE